MKTSIMYAMSLSFIIMVNVFSFIQLQSFEYYLRQSRGSALVIFGVQKTSTTLAANALRYNDMIAFSSLLKNDTEVAGSIKDMGWVTVPLNQILRDFETKVSNVGQIFSRGDARIVAASPNYFDVAEPNFYQSTTSGIGAKRCTVRGCKCWKSSTRFGDPRMHFTI